MTPFGGNEESVWGELLERSSPQTPFKNFQSEIFVRISNGGLDFFSGAFF
jgi:hypothetical protein